MTEHVLKVLPPYFDDIAEHRKTFEVRRNDRGFQRGDVLVLREWLAAPGRFTVRAPEVRAVNYIYSGDTRIGGIEYGYVVLGLSGVTHEEALLALQNVGLTASGEDSGSF